MPDPRAGERVTDRIRVAGISAIGYHGVLEHERRDGQTFVADVVLHVDTRPAAASDRLDLTADYGVLAEQVVSVLQGEPADLIETVAERIAAVAFSHPGVLAVDVVLHKPQAPVTVPFTDVSVEIHRTLDDPPVVGAPPAVLAPDTDAGPDSRRAHDARHTAVALLAPELPAVETEHDRFDRPPAEPVDVVLALGSNVGASHETLRRVVHELASLPGLEVTAIAPLARTGSVGGSEQPDYLNTVVLGRAMLSPRGLLHACQEIETRYGRVREERWGPRTIDIDLIAYGSTVAAADDLELPHPRAHQRAFVLEPWAQVAPDAFLPGLGGGPVAALAGTAPDRGGIRWMALDWWAGPEAGSS